jgi:hypothetical protein
MLKLSILLKLSGLICLVSVTSACSHRLIPIQTLFSSNQCSKVEQTISSINSAEELDLLRETIKSKFSETRPISETIDFQKQTLILMAIGQKTSGGYEIQLQKNEALVKDKTLYLPVRIVNPESNTFQTQGMTSPCQVYLIPKTDFNTILLREISSDR